MLMLVWSLRICLWATASIPIWFHLSGNPLSSSILLWVLPLSGPVTLLEWVFKKVKWLKWTLVHPFWWSEKHIVSLSTWYLVNLYNTLAHYAEFLSALKVRLVLRFSLTFFNVQLHIEYHSQTCSLLFLPCKSSLIKQDWVSPWMKWLMLVILHHYVFPQWYGVNLTLRHISHLPVVFITANVIDCL